MHAAKILSANGTKALREARLDKPAAEIDGGGAGSDEATHICDCGV